MKLCLIAVNSNYVHTNPAVRSLSARIGAEYIEYNINQPMQDVLRGIYEQEPQIVAFSCYIWNREYVLRLAEDLKAVRPELPIWLGGPEVSFCAAELMQRCPFVDAIFCGEAEETLAQWMNAWNRGEKYGGKSVLYRDKDTVCGGCEWGVVQEMDSLAPPLLNEEYDPNKIYYYESSRGCPFSCAYCLSGTGHGVREKSLFVVKRDIDTFLRHQAKLIKFTDRTFNANADRAKKILQYICAQQTEACFHFEVALDLMDGEMLHLLRSAPKGRFQLEAGVQSCNGKTLAAVSRKTDIEKIQQNAAALLEAGNIHLHLDLIAGLPFEDLHSFERSFDMVYRLYPQMLQLGFLKLLRGSALREKCADFGIKYRSYPPYEVLETKELSAEDLFLLKGVEKMLNGYYNTGRARTAIDLLTQNGVVTPFQFYAGLYRYCNAQGHNKRPLSARDQMIVLADYAIAMLAQPWKSRFLELLLEDYKRMKIKGRIPENMLLFPVTK